jgi:uncharacterized protein (DUF342 family)
MSEKIKGKLEVIIDPDEKHAHLKFIPSGPEQRWDSDRIDGLLDKNDVTAGIDDDVIEKLLMELPRLKETRTYSNVAVFEPPEEAVSETAALTADPVPDNLLPWREKALLQAGAPQIVEIRTEKVQGLLEDVSEKKGLFAKLGRDKEEPSGQEIKKTVRIPVNPELRDLRFCINGQKVGDYRPPYSGKPGKTVTGQPIPPERIAFKKFYTGKGIERRGQEFFATATGFLRLGENWVDVAPFSAHEWDISGDSAGTTFFLNFQPGLESLPPPEKESLARLLDAAAVPADRRITLDDVYSAVLAAVEKNQPLVGFPLCTGRDSEIRIDINPVQTKAELYLSKASGTGTPLSYKAIGEALSGAKLVKLDIERIKGDIQKFIKSRDTEISILLTEGKDPKRGKDRELSYQVDFLEQSRVMAIMERILQVPDTVRLIRSINEFPPQKIDKMALVKKGDTLFSIASGSEGEPGLNVYGKKIPGISGNEPNIKLFEGISFKDGTAYADEDGILDMAEGENSLYLARIRKHRDAEILVSVSDNKMNAYVSVKKEEGSGLPIGRDYTMDVLEQNLVVSGIREDLVLDVVAKSIKGEMIADFLIAEGKLPAGKEAVLKFLVPIDPGKQSAVNIKKDEPFAEIHSYEKDDSLGFNVLGEKIDLGPESGLQIEIGSNIRKDPQGEKTILIAEKNGRLLYDGKSLLVKDKLTVQGDVSLKSGSIKFPGSVDITGSILSRVTVTAGENIKVGEVIQDSFVSSDGNLMIGKGIKGARKAVVRASGSMKFVFAEEANLFAVGDVHVGKAIMLCHVKCNGKIRGDSDSKLIGGVIKSKDGMEIGTIGSERGAKTTISFGQDYLVENQISVVNVELEKLRVFVEKLDEIMERLEKSSDKTKLLEIRKKKLQTMKMIEKKNLRLFLLREKFESHFPSEIKIFEKVYPGVVIESHGRCLEINDERKGFIVTFDPSNGKLVEKKL